MTERGEGLARAPRRYGLGEQGQLRRRLVYALYEMPSLDARSRAVLATWQPPRDAPRVQESYQRLARLLDAAGIPRVLPRNAASPARIRPRRRRVSDPPNGG